MRIGIKKKTRRGEKKPQRVDAKVEPRHAAAGSVVGQLSPDIISTYFEPRLIMLAQKSLSAYVDNLLRYNDMLRDLDSVRNETEANKLLKKPSVPLYQSQYWVDRLEETLVDTADFFQSKDGSWKIQVNAARFERRMDEKYGIFRPFLKEHPELESLVRSVQRKYAQGYFSPFRQGKPPIPKSTAVIILFMMQRGNIHWQVTLFSVLFFLVGLQPWALVTMVAGFNAFYERRKRKPKAPMVTRIPATQPYYTESKEEMLLRPVGGKLHENETIDGSEYDTILLGHGVPALYTAALLSRAGRKVLVLSNKSDASGCYEIENAPASVMERFEGVAFDVEPANISRISRVQQLLIPALSTSTDAQGGLRFAQIGSHHDGYTFEVLSVPGMGAHNGSHGALFALKGDGTPTLMESAAVDLADGWPGLDGDLGNSTTGAYAAACDAINKTSSAYHMGKVMSESINNLRKVPTFYEMAIRHASSSLDRGFPVNAHTRSLMAAIGMRSENIKPNATSMGAHVSNISAALSGEGMHYPIGGPRAICHALATVVEQNGGRIVSNAPIESLLFEEETLPRPTRKSVDGKEQELVPPDCIGVKLADNRAIRLGSPQKHRVSPAVVSMLGMLTTFIRLLPEDIRTKYKVPRGLPALSERRPVFKVMFAIDGSARDLDLSGADFYRLPGAALAHDEIDPVTEAVLQGEIGWRDDEEESSNNLDVDTVNEVDSHNIDKGEETRRKRAKAGDPKKQKGEKFVAGSSWIHISFPSAKDPSFESRHGRVTTCIVEIEADDDFVTPFDTKPKLYVIRKGKESSGDHQRLIDRVKSDLLRNYPQLEGKILYSQLVGPMHQGLSHTPERYAAKGVRPKSPYPNLFVGGSDLTVDSLSGSLSGSWLAANAVMEYNWLDYLVLQKSITSDIIQCLEPPRTQDEEDIAVPFPDNDESSQ